MSAMQAYVNSAVDGFRYAVTRDDETGLMHIVLQIRWEDEWRDTRQSISIEMCDARLLVGAMGRLVTA